MSASNRWGSSVPTPAIVPTTSSRRVSRHAATPVLRYGDGAVWSRIVHHAPYHPFEVGALGDVARSAAHRVLDHLLGGGDLGHPAVELVGMVRRSEERRVGKVEVGVDGGV